VRDIMRPNGLAGFNAFRPQAHRLSFGPINANRIAQLDSFIREDLQQMVVVIQ